MVIKNKDDYIHEGLSQLGNTEHYQPLDEDPTKTFNGPILYTIKQANVLNIFDVEVEKDPVYQVSKDTKFLHATKDTQSQ